MDDPTIPDNDCGGQGLPTRVLSSPALTPADAVHGLIGAAARQDTTAAAAYVGGALANFDSGLLVPDVYGYLTSTAGLDPAHWLLYPPSCAADSTDPTLADCSIVPPDGSIPLYTEVRRDGRYWVVSAIGAG